MRGWGLCKKLTTLLQSQPEKLNDIAFEYQALVDQFNDIFPTVPSEFFVALFCAIVPEKFDYILSDVLSKDEVTYDMIIKLTMSALARSRENETESTNLISNCSAMPNNQPPSNQSNSQNIDHNTKKNRKPNSFVNPFHFCSSTNSF